MNGNKEGPISRSGSVGSTDRSSMNTPNSLGSKIFGRSSSSTSPFNSPSLEMREIKDKFTKIDLQSRTLLYEAIQTLRVFKTRSMSDKEWDEEEAKINSLVLEIRGYLDELKGIADDMNRVKENRLCSPRIVDQAKTYTLTVHSLQTNLRKLLMEFHFHISSKQRQDLFTLSRSPFDEDGTSRRRVRVGGAQEISSGATESLLHSRRVLLETVNRCTGTIDQLANSSSSIQSNQDELAGQNALISVSKKLLGKYGRREWTDKVLICLAIVFFLACVIYVIQKRLF